MDRDDVIRKIKKCLSLAKSTNQAEAAAALRQAQALMREHRLDETGVGMASVKTHETRARLIPIVVWEAALADLVAGAFGCQVISTTRSSLISGLQLKRARFWRYIGLDSAPEVAAYTFEVLADQCVRDRRAHIARQSKNCKPATRTARGDAFAVGWVHGVEALVERFAQRPERTEMVNAFIEATYPHLGNAKVQDRQSGRNVRDDARHGHRAGEKAVLNRGVSGPLERRLIGAA